MRQSLTFVFSLLLAGTTLAQQPQPEATEALPALVQLLAQAADEPLPELPLKEARRTLGQARQRYQRGLPAGSFYLTARVLNESATPEPVLVRVAAWQGSRISGHIVRATADGGAVIATAPIEFEEPDVLDWLVLRPNGAEEGNYLGKFLELQDRLAALPEN